MSSRRKRRATDDAYALWRVGDKVRAMYPPDGTWHNAKVIKIVEESTEVCYNDGVQRLIKNHQIKQCPGSYSSIQVSDARNGLRSAFSQLVAIAKQSKIEAFEPGFGTLEEMPNMDGKGPQESESNPTEEERSPEDEERNPKEDEKVLEDDERNLKEEKRGLGDKENLKEDERGLGDEENLKEDERGLGDERNLKEDERGLGDEESGSCDDGRPQGRWKMEHPEKDERGPEDKENPTENDRGPGDEGNPKEDEKCLGDEGNLKGDERGPGDEDNLQEDERGLGDQGNLKEDKRGLGDERNLKEDERGLRDEESGPCDDGRSQGRRKMEHPEEDEKGPEDDKENPTENDRGPEDEGDPKEDEKGLGDGGNLKEDKRGPGDEGSLKEDERGPENEGNLKEDKGKPEETERGSEGDGNNSQGYQRQSEEDETTCKHTGNERKLEKDEEKCENDEKKFEEFQDQRSEGAPAAMCLPSFATFRDLLDCEDTRIGLSSAYDFNIESDCGFGDISATVQKALDALEEKSSIDCTDIDSTYEISSEEEDPYEYDENIEEPKRNCVKRDTIDERKDTSQTSQEGPAEKKLADDTEKDEKENEKAEVEDEAESADEVDSGDECDDKDEVGECVRLPLSLRGEQVYDKRYPCFFCKATVLKFARHVFDMHPEMPQVKEAANFPKKSKQRDQILESLRKEAYFRHNQEVLDTGRGILIVERRSSTHKYTPADYRPCYGCKGWFHKDTMKIHAKNCVEGEYNRRTAQDMYHAMFVKEDVQDSFRPVLASMAPDAITEIVKGDNILMQHGQEIFERHNYQKEHLASTPMRQLARLIQQISLDSTTSKTFTIKELICPQNYDMLVKGTRTLCKFNLDKTKSTPSLALKIGHGLKSCAAIIRNACIRSQDKEGQDTICQYLMLHDSEWHKITRYALDALEIKRQGQSTMLPLSADLQKVRKSCDQVMMEKKLSNSKEYRNYCHHTLARVIIFNAKRGGEAGRMSIENYQQVLQTDTDGLDLSPLEVKLCDRMRLIHILSKTRKMVPIILTPEMCDAIDTIIAERPKYAENGNEFVFAMPHSQKSYMGWTALKAICKPLGLQNAAAITSTKIRKHVASSSQVMDLKENEIEWLCTHMGHTVNVHREYYRLPKNTLEVAKIGKLLLAVEKGSSVYKGKTLDDINLSEDDISGDEESKGTVRGKKSKGTKEKVKQQKATASRKCKRSKK